MLPASRRVRYVGVTPKKFNPLCKEAGFPVEFTVPSVILNESCSKVKKMFNVTHAFILLQVFI